MDGQDTSDARVDCPDTERLVDVCGILHDDPVRALTHLLECAECRQTIELIGQVREAHQPAQARTDSLVERVLREVELPTEHPGRSVSEPPRIMTWALAATSWAFAGLAGFSGILIVSSGTVDIGLPGAAMAALVTGLIPVVHGALIHRRSPLAGT